MSVDRGKGGSALHGISINNKEKLLWTESFELLQTFVEEVLNLSNGVWSCPGGVAKQYKDEDIDFRWYPDTQSITLKGKAKDVIREKMLSLAAIQGQLVNTVNKVFDQNNHVDETITYSSQHDNNNLPLENVKTKNSPILAVEVNEVIDISTTFGTPIINSSQSQRRCEAFNLSNLSDKLSLDRVALFESEFSEYKEKINQSISNILVQLSESKNIIRQHEIELQKKGDEIAQLKSDNLHLYESLNKLKSKFSPAEHIKHVQINDEITPGVVNVIHYDQLNNEHVNDPVSLIHGIDKHSSLEIDQLSNLNAKNPSPIVIETNEDSPLLIDTQAPDSNRNLDVNVDSSTKPIKVNCILRNENKALNSKSVNERNTNPEMIRHPDPKKSITPCPFLKRRGWCLKGARCDFKHSRDEQKHLVPCPFLQNRGFCLKGSRCDFSHGGNYPYHLSPPRPANNYLTRSFYYHHQFPQNYPRRQGFFQTYPKPLMEISVQHPLPHTSHNYPYYRTAHAETLV